MRSTFTLLQLLIASVAIIIITNYQSNSNSNNNNNGVGLGLASAYAPPITGIGALLFKPQNTKLLKSSDLEESKLVEAGKFFVDAFW